jgi:hypothetical protein
VIEMKKSITILSAVTLLVGFAHAGMGQILASWPSPKYPNTISINGIAFEGEYVWVKSIDAESNAVLKCTKSGSFVNEISFPYHGYGESYGLAFDGQYLWTIYPQPQGPIRYDHYVKYTTTGSEAYVFLAHTNRSGFSKSVSWDGQNLWTDEWRTGSIYDAGKYTTTGSLLATYTMPPHWSTAAGYYNRQIWAGGLDNYVYGMSILGSSVVASFPAPGGSCRAVGFDGDYLWTADANTPQYIYKVDIDVVDVEPDSFGKIKGMFR